VRNQLSLKQLFVIWLITLATLTLTASLALAYFSSYEKTISEALKLSKTQTSRLALLTERVMTTDTSLLKETISEIAAKSLVKEVLIVSPENKVIYSSRTSLVGLSLDQTVLAKQKIELSSNNSSVAVATHADKNLIVSSMSFVWPASDAQIRSHKRGWVFITSDIAARINSKIKQELLDRTIAFLVALGIAGITWLVAFRKLSEPLRILTQAAQRVSHGDYSHRIPTMRFKEFSVIRDSFVDMTNEVERKIRSLSDSESIFRLLLRRAPVGIVAFDHNLILRHMNDAFINMTGRQCLFANATTLEEFFNLIRDAVTDKTDNINWDCLKNRLPVSDADIVNESTMTFELQSGKRTMKVYSVDAGYGAISKVLYFQDVTNELALDKMKSQFIATAAHELRTPMTSIRGYAELLAHMGDEISNKEKMIEAIRAEAEDVVYLLDELLDIAKIDAGIISEPHLAATLVEHFLEELCQRFRVHGDERLIEFIAQPNLPIVMCDQQKIKQAVKACLSNAFKFSSSDSKITLSVSPAKLNGNSAIKIDISDQGVGMTQEQSERAFERFYRAETSGSIPGTGLGLSLVKEIIDLHQGKVTINSHLGKGTTISMYLLANPFGH
jgi:signal transduction histidine kinase/HAMP domain-containing protein